MGVKLSYKEVKQRIESEGYILISQEYKNSSEKLNVRCPKGHDYPVTIGKFSSGRRCPYCNNRVKIREEDVVKHLNEEGYNMISDFVNGNEKIIATCPNGHEWRTTYQKFKKGVRCSFCNGWDIRERQPPRKWNTEKVKNILSKDEYVLISEYRNSSTKIKVTCPKGHQRSMYFGHYLKGHRCAICSGASRAQKELSHSVVEVDSFLRSIGYIRKGEYKGTHRLVEMVCSEGHEFSSTLANIKSGTRCNKCQSSKDERKIMSGIESIGIPYQNELFIKHDDKKSNMYFDFAFYNEEKNLRLLVEYDGQHHFLPYRGEKELKKVQERDIRKNEYCIKHGIPLLRIPYTALEEAHIIINEYLTRGTISNKDCTLF